MRPTSPALLTNWFDSPDQRPLRHIPDWTQHWMLFVHRTVQMIYDVLAMRAAIVRTGSLPGLREQVYRVLDWLPPMITLPRQELRGLADAEADQDGVHMSASWACPDFWTREDEETSRRLRQAGYGKMPEALTGSRAGDATIPPQGHPPGGDEGQNESNASRARGRWLRAEETRHIQPGTFRELPTELARIFAVARNGDNPGVDEATVLRMFEEWWARGTKGEGGRCHAEQEERVKEFLIARTRFFAQEGSGASSSAGPAITQGESPLDRGQRTATYEEQNAGGHGHLRVWA